MASDLEEGDVDALADDLDLVPFPAPRARC
jgi:hypothetical protein